MAAIAQPHAAAKPGFGKCRACGSVLLMNWCGIRMRRQDDLGFVLTHADRLTRAGTHGLSKQRDRPGEGNQAREDPSRTMVRSHLVSSPYTSHKLVPETEVEDA